MHCMALRSSRPCMPELSPLDNVGKTQNNRREPHHYTTTYVYHYYEREHPEVYALLNL